MHPSYTDKHVQQQIKTAYRANPLPSVQLQNFLLPGEYTALVKACKDANYKDETIPDRYSRSVAKLPAKWEQYFRSGEFRSFIKAVTGKQFTGKPRIERYGWRSFTLRNDEEKPPGLLVYFDCTAAWHGNFGGATIISSEEGELARVQPLPNTLILIDCSKAWPFVQYINHYSEKSAIVRISFQ